MQHALATLDAAQAFVVKQTYLKERLERIQKEMIIADQCYTAALQAREIVVTVAKQTQQNLESRLTDIGTMALAAVFPDPYEFILRFEERRNQTEADLLLTRGGEEFSPLDSTGGGVSDVVAFALRVAALAMQPNRRILLLDEPFKNLSADLQGRASAMVKMLSAQLNMQFIIVSHEQDIIECADNIFNL